MALTVIESPPLAEIKPSISTFFTTGAPGDVLVGAFPGVSGFLPLSPLSGGPGMPPLAVGPDTPSPASSLCAPITTADGATGFIDDFESPHAAVMSEPAITSDQVTLRVVIASPVSHNRGEMGDV